MIFSAANKCQEKAPGQYGEGNPKKMIRDDQEKPVAWTAAWTAVGFAFGIIALEYLLFVV